LIHFLFYKSGVLNLFGIASRVAFFYELRSPVSSGCFNFLHCICFASTRSA